MYFKLSLGGQDKNRSSIIILYFLGVLALFGCVAPTPESNETVDMSSIKTANDVLALPIQNLYPKMLTDQLEAAQLNSALTLNSSLAEAVSNAGELAGESSESQEGVDSMPPVSSDEENSVFNLSPFVASSATKIDLPDAFLVNRYEGRLNDSLERDMTPELDLSSIDLTNFSLDNIDETMNILLGDGLVIEVDPPLPDIDQLREDHANFFSVSADPDDNPDYLVDGYQDDIEIQEALRIVFENGGGMVYLFPGTYYIQKQLGVWDHTTLKGSGRVGDRKTIIKLHDFSDDLGPTAGIIRMKKDFLKGAYTKRVKYVAIEDFIVDGNKDNQRQDVGDAEKKYGYFGEGDYITIRRITARNCQGYGFDPHASHDTMPSKYMLIEDSYAHHNYKDGFTLDMVQESRVVNNVAEYNHRHGFNVITHAREIVIADNISRYNDVTGLKMQNGAHSITYINNQFYNNAGEGIYLRSSSDNLFVANSIFNNGKDGVRLSGSRYTLFEENFIGFNGLSGARYVEIKIQDYQGFYEGNPDPAISQLNQFFHNSIVSDKTREVLIELDSSKWNVFNENTIWSNGGGIHLIHEESKALDNIHYPQL